MKGVYIFMADGFEDIEALATRDVLMRGGVETYLVSINESPEVVSARGLTVIADVTITDLFESQLAEIPSTDKDMMIFPGGMPGSQYLGECDSLIDMMNEHYAQGGSLAAICAAPAYVLSQLKGIEKAEFTCYDGCQSKLEKKGATFKAKPSVTWERVITGRGPGHTIDFALAILSFLKGKETADQVSAGLTLSVD